MKKQNFSYYKKEILVLTISKGWTENPALSTFTQHMSIYVDTHEGVTKMTGNLNSPSFFNPAVSSHIQ